MGMLKCRAISRHKAVFPTAVGPVITISVLADDTSLRVFDKRADVFYLLRVGVLGASLGHTFLHHTLRVDDTLGILDGLDGLVRETAAAHSDKVHSCVAYGFLTSDNVWRNVLTGTCSALEHTVSANVQELVEQAACRDDSVVVDDYLAGKLSGVADDTTITYLAVVSDVHILHQQIAVTYGGLTLRSSTTADGYVLADRVVIANLTCSLFALEFQVLRLC